LPDGAWNGKIWERERLLSGVEKGERDALAEWAYCCRRGLLKLPHNYELIYQRAKRAAEKGSLMGKRIIAKCVRHGEGTEANPQKAFELFSELNQLNCPDARIDLASYHLSGQFVERNVLKAQELIAKADQEGAVRAIVAKADFETRNLAQGRDPRKIMNSYLRAFRTVPDVYNASEIYNLLIDGKLGEMDKSSRSALFSNVRKVVAQGMELNHPFAFITQSFYEFNAPEGNKHLAVALQVRSANLGDTSAMGNITKWMRQGLRKNYGGGYQLLAKGNAQDYLAAGDLAFKRGSTKSAARLSYATKLSRSEGANRVANHQKAAEILKGLIAEGECNAHDVLGTQRIQEHVKFKGVKSEMDLGFAHLIYHSNHSSYSLYLLGLFYGDKVEATYDPVKQAAVYKFSLSKFEGERNDSDNEATRRLPVLGKQLTAGQQKELGKLMESGFPSATQFRKPAYELLVNAGDLPKDWKFNQWPSPSLCINIGRSSLFFFAWGLDCQLKNQK
jgi:TPR repeat protein